MNLGNIISDAHGIKGNNILPNHPINIGNNIEGIINITWKVILGLYRRDEHVINPGKANSNHNIIDNAKQSDTPINRDIINTATIYIWLVVVIIKKLLLMNLSIILYILNSLKNQVRWLTICTYKVNYLFLSGCDSQPSGF